jgi:hypothetical protein
MEKKDKTTEKAKIKELTTEKPKGPEPENNTSAKDAKKVSVTKKAKQ